MRKSQMEMVGLLVIIILLLLAGFFYLLFTISPQKDITASARTSIFAGNLLNSLLKYDVCQGSSLKDAIKSCDDGLPVCGQDGCGLLKDNTEKIMSELWKKDYYISFSFGEEDFLVIGSYDGTGIAYVQYINVPGKGVYSAKILLEE